MIPLWQQILLFLAPPILIGVIFVWWKALRNPSSGDSTRPLRSNRKRRRHRNRH